MIVSFVLLAPSVFLHALLDTDFKAPGCLKGNTYATKDSFRELHNLCTEYRKL